MHVNLKNLFPTQEMSLHWQPAAADASHQLWLKKCSRQACGIQYSSSIRLPEPIPCCFETWATSCEKGIQMTWKENLAALKSMVEFLFFSRTRMSLPAVAKLLFAWNCFPTEEC